MIRLWLVFGIIFLLFFFGIKILRSLTGKEAWQLTKLLAYSTMCSLLALAVMIGIVFLF